MKTIKKYPGARLMSCGSRAGNLYKYSHENGCYLKLKNQDTKHSIEYDGRIVLDFNNKNKLIGIDFEDGIPPKIKKRKKKK